MMKNQQFIGLKWGILADMGNLWSFIEVFEKWVQV
jgi:hypothetical protein